jgi:hypothetical protein
VPFTETARCKALVLTVATAAGAGIATSGGAAATNYLGAHHPAPGTYYGVATYGHSGPDHNEPDGEFTYIEASPTIGTASVSHHILGSGD